MKIWKFSTSGLLRGAVAAAFAGAVVLGLGLPAQASLIGDPFTLTTQVVPGTFVDNDTVGAGAEFTTGDGSGVGTFFDNFGTASFIDVGASSITFFFDFGHGGLYTFSDLNWTDDPSGTIQSVSINQALGFGTFASLVQLNSTADTVAVSINCGGFGGAVDFCELPGGTQLVVDIATTHDNGDPPPVPEPSSVMLFGAGLGMLGLMVMTRRRRQAA